LKCARHPSDLNKESEALYTLRGYFTCADMISTFLSIKSHIKQVKA